MGQQVFSLLERKKLLSLLSIITFALILAFHCYIKLPCGSNVLQHSLESVHKTMMLNNSYVNVIDNHSSITMMPKETEGSLVKVPETTTILEMDKLLLKNHSSYQSMVYMSKSNF